MPSLSVQWNSVHSSWVKQTQSIATTLPHGYSLELLLQPRISFWRPTPLCELQPLKKVALHLGSRSRSRADVRRVSHNLTK